MNDSPLVFSSDRNGNQHDLYRLESADAKHPGDLYDALQYRVERMTSTPEDERVPAMAPDYERVAFRRGATDNLQKNHEKLRGHYPFGERLPYAAWTKPVATLPNENMEHGPARPDIRVENPPGIKAEGEDPQLGRAVEVLLDEEGDD